MKPDNAQELCICGKIADLSLPEGSRKYYICPECRYYIDKCNCKKDAQKDEENKPDMAEEIRKKVWDILVLDKVTENNIEKALVNTIIIDTISLTSRKIFSELEDKFDKAIWKWAVEEGGDKLHFKEIITEVIYKEKSKYLGTVPENMEKSTNITSVRPEERSLVADEKTSRTLKAPKSESTKAEHGLRIVDAEIVTEELIKREMDKFDKLKKRDEG